MSILSILSFILLVAGSVLLYVSDLPTTLATAVVFLATSIWLALASIREDIDA
jgi:hypothetical protein